MASASAWITVGRVGRPHGLDGAFVVDEASTDPERFAPGSQVWVGRRPATVAERKRAGNRLVIRLDRRAPRGSPLELPVTELPPAGEGSYYVFELVGLSVEEQGGRALGRVEDVMPGPANDALVLDTGIALPLVDDCVRSVDLDRKRIVVAPSFVPES